MAIDMRRLENANAIQGSLAWTRPLRLKIAIFPQARREAAASIEAPAIPSPQRYVIDRERIFDYMRTHRLPDAAARQRRRDMRNRADFIADVRELQTRPDPAPRGVPEKSA